MRVVFLVLAVAFLAGGCSGDKPMARGTDASQEQVLKHDCDNPKWKEQNLGLWYSVCRQPLRW